MTVVVAKGRPWVRGHAARGSLYRALAQRGLVTSGPVCGWENRGGHLPAPFWANPRARSRAARNEGRQQSQVNRALVENAALTLLPPRTAHQPRRDLNDPRALNTRTRRRIDCVGPDPCRSKRRRGRCRRGVRRSRHRSGLEDGRWPALAVGVDGCPLPRRRRRGARAAAHCDEGTPRARARGLGSGESPHDCQHHRSPSRSSTSVRATPASSPRRVGIASSSMGARTSLPRATWPPASVPRQLLVVTFTSTLSSSHTATRTTSMGSAPSCSTLPTETRAGKRIRVSTSRVFHNGLVKRRSSLAEREMLGTPDRSRRAPHVALVDDPRTATDANRPVPAVAVRAHRTRKPRNRCKLLGSTTRQRRSLRLPGRREGRSVGSSRWCPSSDGTPGLPLLSHTDGGSSGLRGEDDQRPLGRLAHHLRQRQRVADRRPSRGDAGRARRPERLALRADVLKVPHHGSDDVSRRFIDTVAPLVSVISAGDEDARRDYLHPRANLLAMVGQARRGADPVVFVTNLAAFDRWAGEAFYADEGRRGLEARRRARHLLRSRAHGLRNHPRAHRRTTAACGPAWCPRGPVRSVRLRGVARWNRSIIGPRLTVGLLARLFELDRAREPIDRKDRVGPLTRSSVAEGATMIKTGAVVR
jgi:hypothetical protein